MSATLHLPDERRRDARLVRRRRVVLFVAADDGRVAAAVVEGGPVVGAPLSGLALLQPHLPALAASVGGGRQFSTVDSIVVDHARGR